MLITNFIRYYLCPISTFTRTTTHRRTITM